MKPFSNIYRLLRQILSQYLGDQIGERMRVWRLHCHYTFCENLRIINIRMKRVTYVIMNIHELVTAVCTKNKNIHTWIS